MISLDALLQKMEVGEIIKGIQMPPADVDRMLEKRDDAIFSTRWTDLFTQVGEKKAAMGLTQDADSRVARLRERAFMQSYNRWKSPDLAAYISDDFGLIGDALAIGFAEWIYFSTRISREDFRRMCCRNVPCDMLVGEN